jgi:hypothetical protein
MPPAVSHTSLPPACPLHQPLQLPPSLLLAQERQQEELLQLLGALGVSGHSAIRLKMHSACGKEGCHAFTSTLSRKLAQQVDNVRARGWRGGGRSGLGRVERCLLW